MRSIIMLYRETRLIMRDAIFKTLEARWQELYDQYESVKAALPTVVRWEWTKGERYNPRAFYFERNPPRGRTLKQPPQNKDEKTGCYEYGFDAQNRVIVERQYGIESVYIADGINEAFYHYSTEQIEVITYA